MVSELEVTQQIYTCLCSLTRSCARSVVAQLLNKFLVAPFVAAKVLGCVSALDGRWTGAGSRWFRQIISAKALSYVAIVTYLTQ